MEHRRDDNGKSTLFFAGRIVRDWSENGEFDLIDSDNLRRNKDKETSEQQSERRLHVSYVQFSLLNNERRNSLTYTNKSHSHSICIRELRNASANEK